MAHGARARAAVMRARLSVALAAVVLALAGDAALRMRPSPVSGYVLQIAAALLLALGAWPKTGPPCETPVPRPGRRGLVAAGLALAGAVALTGISLRLFAKQRLAGAEAPWMAACALVLLAGILAPRATAFPARWSLPPAGLAVRRLTWAAAVGILALASALRLPALSRIPVGINADEGDQAAVALSILRGRNVAPLFDVGWYHIPIVFYRLLAAVMSVAGENVAGARTLSAVSGIVTVAAVLLLGVRHFGRRAGLLAGLLVATMGPAIQFSRETTCAAPTAALWTLSVLFFLEAARSGRAWAWALAGLTGGVSLYFYPSGRLWALLATGFVAVVLAFDARGFRKKLLGGAAVAALAALLAAAPFLFRAYLNPEWFVIRARETSVFVKANPLRLPYYDPSWSTPRLLAAQLDRSLGIFNRFPDGNYFWPTGKPILPLALSGLTLLGLLASMAKARDPRLALLALWFWTGFVGVVVTVETPNLHRMATAVPVLGIFAALVLDEIARRAGPLAAPAGRAAVAATALAGLAAAGMAAREIAFYFGPYAASDAWPWPRTEGEEIAREGRDAWALSLSRQYHMVNSGWVYHLAPETSRGGVLTPGAALPLALPANRGLAFFLYQRQGAYLPYLEALYPGGTPRQVSLPDGSPAFTVYRVPRDVWAAGQGALAHAGGRAFRVARLGDVPAGVAPGTAVRWTSSLRIRRFWNYVFRAGPGPARLAVDGIEVLRAEAGAPPGEAAVHLARGDHFVEFTALVPPDGAEAMLLLAPYASPDGPPLRFERPSASALAPREAPAGGLFAVVTAEDGVMQERRDGTIASGGFSDETGLGGRAYRTVWTGTFFAGTEGVYGMGLFSEGESALSLDGRLVVHGAGEDPPQPATAAVTLARGAHHVEITFEKATGSGGIEWTFTPPGGRTSIVPPTVLGMPPGAGVGPPLDARTLESVERVLPDRALFIHW